jgi:hypothetical protein
MSDTEKAAIQAAFAAYEAIRKAIDAYEAAGFGSVVTDPLHGALSDVSYSIKEATS